MNWVVDAVRRPSAADTVTTHTDVVAWRVVQMPYCMLVQSPHHALATVGIAAQDRMVDFLRRSFGNVAGSVVKLARNPGDVQRLLAVQLQHSVPRGKIEYRRAVFRRPGHEVDPNVAQD